tara:strand:- start:40 stop:264 length:225 start_codon:yes stop_codon:yes gene_type:complete
LIDGKTFRQGFDKFMKAEVTKNARMQVQLPNGEFYDIVGIKLLENKIIGSKDTHRLVLSCKKPVESMGDPVKIL